MKNIKKNQGAGKRDPVAYGFAGSLFLVMAYFLLLTVLNSFDHAIDQFFSLGYWIIILSAGFGIQTGLYVHVKNNMCANTAEKAEIAASGGISGASMLGCCAHHVTDIAPILGLSAASLFLSRYQTSFMMLGVFSNLVGITMMLAAIQKYKLFGRNSSFKALFSYDMKFVRNLMMAFAVIAVSFSFYSAYAEYTTGTTANTAFSLPEKVNSENLVTISAKPVISGASDPIAFSITLTTHQGSLDYDLTKISVLEDSKGNIYRPIDWSGSPPGGHHRSGTLTFPPLKEPVKSIKLVIKGVYNVPERIFMWDLI